MQRSFHGALAALLTPRKSDGTIDEAGFARNIDFILEHGGTGEYAAFSMAERKALFAQAVTANRGRGGTHSRTDSSLQFGGVL